MTNLDLAQSYMVKVVDRLDVLDFLFKKEDYSDVVRESQEVVELALKGMLRTVGIEPPKIHDVGAFLLEHRDKFPSKIRISLKKMALISKELRKDRELSFYGEIDFIPTEEYSARDAQKAMQGARYVASIAVRLMKTFRRS
ncbi:MAG: HEPN domain-containing protein [Chlamydiae bacterium]|nr:HEPN domain-containing protein [Chlamydiota bacterium]MBI3277345.1 HEPN domain-containing protein [Chlamydiota bacterium]